MNGGIIVILMMASMLVGCGAVEDCANLQDVSIDVTKVSVSVPPLAYFVEQIAQDDAIVCSMFSIHQSPELSEPSFRKKSFFNESNLYFKVGVPGFLFEDQYLDKISSENPKLTVINLSSYLPSISKQRLENKRIDPHIWVSIQHIPLLTKTITDSLKQIRPNRAQFYTSNRKKLLKRMDDTHRNIQKWAKISQLLIVNAHPALHYLAKEYNFATSILEDESKEITLWRLHEINAKIKQYPNRVLIVDPGHFSKIAENFAQQFQMPIVEWSPMKKDLFDNLNTLSHQVSNQFNQVKR